MTRPAALLLVALAAWCLACSAPEDGGPGAFDRLYLADARGGTVVHLDADGRVTGPRRQAGLAPWALAPATDGSVLALGSPGRDDGAVTRLPPIAGGGRRRPVPPEAVALGGRALRLAGDGERYAVLAYVPGPVGAAAGPAAPCWLALVDVPTGTVVHRHPACAPGDRVVSLALEPGAGGPTAYLGLWRSSRRGVLVTRTAKPVATGWTGDGRAVQAEAAVARSARQGQAARVRRVPSVCKAATTARARWCGVAPDGG